MLGWDKIFRSLALLIYTIVNKITSIIPDFLTCLNLLSGCVAIIFAFSANQIFGSLCGWQIACIALACATVFDFFDGFMARLLHAYSELGKQLDSLSDLVSFGVAPAMLIMNMLEGSGAPVWVSLTTLLIPVCAALRLANFNIDERQTTSFIGMPVPASAIFWIGYAGILASGASGGQWAGNAAVALPAVLVISALMVSPLPMFSLKFKSFGWKSNGLRWILIAASIVLIATLGLPGLSAIILLYILLSIASTIFAK